MPDPIAEGQCCVDCLVLLANGETSPDMSEEQTKEYLNRVAERNPPGTVTLGGLDHECRDAEGRIADECTEDQLGFSWGGCDVCGSSLGGDMERVTFWPEPEPITPGPVVTEVAEGNTFIAGVGEVPIYTPPTGVTTVTNDNGAEVTVIHPDSLGAWLADLNATYGPESEPEL
jgi:hypothetical protein